MYCLTAPSIISPKSEYLLRNLGLKSFVIPSISCKTKTWPSQSTPAPIPIVGIVSCSLSTDIENRRIGINNLIDYFIQEKDVKKSDIQAIWSFSTNSAESALGPIIQMRDDALERIGGGIGCTIESVEENYGEDNLTLRRITGTFTTPQYTLSEYTPTLISSGSKRAETAPVL